MNIRLAWLFGGLVVVAIVGLLAPDTTAALGTYDVAIATMTALTWYGSTRPANDRVAWTLVAAGITCWCLGDLVWDTYTYLDWERPGVSFADALYLAGYPLLAAAIVRMVVLRTPGRYREGMLDGIAFTIAAAIATWALLVVPTTRDATFLDAVVWGAYPFADTLLFAGVAWLVLSPGRRGLPTALLVAFLAGTFVLDVLWTAMPLVDDSFNTALLNAGYPLTYGFIAAAALLPNSGEITDACTPQGRMHPARFVLLGFALMMAPSIAIATTTNLSVESELFLFGASTLLASIVLWRFRIAVRERERIQDALAHQVVHDQLTGLFNRRGWTDQLTRLLSSARRSGRMVGVLYVDLDGFKPVNDTWGHAAGDDVLVEVGKRLEPLVRPHDVVARLGGDEFAIGCGDLRDVREAEAIAARVVDKLREPFDVDGEAARVTASVGVTMSTELSEAEQLLVEADAAMYRAKQDGGSRYASDTARSPAREDVLTGR